MTMTNDERYDAIYVSLLKMGVGMTKVVFDRVVTRWTEYRWEVDTHGTDRLFDCETIACYILNG